MGTLAAWGPTIVSVVTAIFLAGQLTGRIKGQEKTLSEHHDLLGEHEDRLNVHSVQLAEGKAWREGYNAGKAGR